MLLVHYTKEQAVLTYNSRTIRALEAALSGTAKMATILAVSTPEADDDVTLPVHVLRYTENYLLDKSSPIYGVLLALQYYYCGELLAI